MLPVLDGLEKEKYVNFINMRQVNHLFVCRYFAQKPYICEKKISDLWYEWFATGMEHRAEEGGLEQWIFTG